MVEGFLLRWRLLSILIYTLTGFNACSLCADNPVSPNDWSLQQDLSLFVNYQFDSVLFYHGLKPLREIDNCHLLFTDTPDGETRKSAAERKNIIADSLSAVSDERDRLYLQAYFNWLLLVIKEKVTDKNLFYAENSLYRKYSHSSHTRLLRTRINNYFSVSTFELTMNAGLGRGFFTRDIDKAMGAHGAVEIGMGLKVRKMLFNFSFKYHSGKLTDEFKKENEAVKIDYAYVTGNDGYSILSPCFAVYYCFKENNRFSIMPMLGIRWSNLQVKNYRYPDIYDVGLLSGIKLEYTLGVSANREESSTFFGLFKHKTIINNIFKTYLEISYTHHHLSFLEENSGHKFNFTAGLSFYLNERVQKNNRIIDI